MSRISVLCPVCLTRRRHNTNRLLVAWHAQERARLWFWCGHCDDAQFIHLQPPSAKAFVGAYDLPNVDLYRTPLANIPTLHGGILLWVNPSRRRRRLEDELDRIITGAGRVNPPTPEVGE